MKIYILAIGGSVMHNLALALQQNGCTVLGSDDEIYEPAHSRLAAANLLPEKEGWQPERITSDIDAVIVGMHARPDNPELKRAIELGLRVYSYPEYIFEHSKQKTRIVVAGSHGKTTTTAMIMHVLKANNLDFDYLVGAQLEGFDTMVHLSDAPIMVIEGDEYLASPLHLTPKIHTYQPHISIITGIAWDHINVFPTFENYRQQFSIFLDTLPMGAKVFFYEKDKNLMQIVDNHLNKNTNSIELQPYDAISATIKNGKTTIHIDEKQYSLAVFGAHNLQNMQAAYLVCAEIGVSAEAFFTAMQTFKGAAKRLQLLRETTSSVTYLDFAHAPSKVKATLQAFRDQFPNRRLTVCLELHTFSSLNKNFLPEYKNALNAADQAIVFYSPHTLAMKRLPPLDAKEMKDYFQHPNLTVLHTPDDLLSHIRATNWINHNLILMTSGNFNGLDFKQL
jgi:UDP-N-acetylmuramate: L-alanyl-gamma-D-glutamyl-meso-diaminopimelate ligase